MYVSSKNASKCSPGVMLFFPAQRVVDTQTDSEGMSGSPCSLPSPCLIWWWTSSSSSHTYVVVSPYCKSCEWQESLWCRDFRQLTEHRAPMDVIVSSSDVDD